ncbi:hypothetical protein MBANPS3_012455, partial [Mucor bainieri]
MERKPYDVIHHNRQLYDNAIRNLVPVFSLKQKRDYFMLRLSQLHEGEAFKQLVTKNDDHVFENTLISESGLIFSVYWNVYQNIHFKIDARPVCSVYGKSRSTGRNVKETLYIHIGVAATFINHNMMPGLIVHHWDWNRFNNHWRNLVWLTIKEHGIAHSGVQQGPLPTEDIMIFVDAKHARFCKGCNEE